MYLDFNQLEKHLKQHLLPAYMVAGDEPFQCSEALDLIRATARSRGYTEREILEHNRWFDWQQLAVSTDSLSLFGNLRLVELRLASAKIGNDGSNAIATWLKRSPKDVLLLIISPKLERITPQPKWIQLLETYGAILTIQSLDRQKLTHWIEKRLQARKIKAEPGVAEWLTEQVEGNLLAGAQEIEKLSLLQGAGPLSLEQAINAVSDSAHYGIFELAHSAMNGDSSHCARILKNIHNGGTESTLVLWVLARETRLIASLAVKTRSGTPISQALAATKDIRKQNYPSYTKAVARLPAWRWQQLLVQCAKADQAIKGIIREDPWILLAQIALGISGVHILDQM